MANIVQIKRSSVPGKKPQDSDLEVGELAVNLYDGILYSKNTTGNVIVVGSSTTSNVIEGANLYFSNVRAIDAVELAVTKLDVTAPGLYYSIDQYSGNNPAIYVTAGETIAFSLSVSGHPFLIRELDGGPNYNNGLTHVSTSGVISTGTSAQGQVAGTLYWKVPYGLRGNVFVYQCSVHSSMVANINILDPNQVASLTTTNVTEGANLYFSNARVYSNILSLGFATNNQLSLYALTNDLTTANVSEVNNLYFTNTRAISAFTAGSGISLASNGRITATATGGGSSLTVGETNTANADLETYTNVTTLKFDSDGGFDVVDLGSGNVKITMNSTFKNWQVAGQNTIVATGLDTIEFVPTNGISITTNTISSPKQIGFNYSGNLNVQSDVRIISVGDREVLLYDSASGKWINNTLTSQFVTEDLNLYFTNTRAISAFTAGSGVSIAANGRITSTVSGSVTEVAGATGAVSNAQLASGISTSGILTTANVSELTNLYFTNTRSISALTAGSGISIASNGRITSTVTGGGGGGSSVATVSNTSPVSGTEGEFWFEPDTDTIYLYNNGSWREFAKLTTAYFASDYENESYDILKLGYNLDQLNNVGGTPLNYQALVYENGNWRPGTVLSYADLTTANTVETTNLFFTNTRARSAFTFSSGISYDSGTISVDPNLSLTSLTVNGNLTVTGGVTTVNARDLSITDNMIFLNEPIEKALSNAAGDGANVTYTTASNHEFVVNDYVKITGITPSGYNTGFTYYPIIATTSNTFTIASVSTGTYVSGGNAYVKAGINPDLGFAGGYDDGTYHHAGLFRDATDGKFKFFHKYTPEPDANIFIDTSHVSFELANVEAQTFVGNVTGNVVGTVSSLSNHNTNNLTEGSTNLYFTNTRVNSYLTDNNKLIPAGTKMLFVQTAAPTGWTKDTTHNDKTLRVVSGSASSGGSLSFATVFTGRTPTGNVGNTTLTSAQSGVPAHSHGVTDPTHAHNATMRTTDSGTINNFDAATTAGTAGTLSTAAASTGISINNNTPADASAGHNHPWTGDSMDFAVQYVDVIIATKD